MTQFPQAQSKPELQAGPLPQPPEDPPEVVPEVESIAVRGIVSSVPVTDPAATAKMSTAPLRVLGVLELLRLKSTAMAAALPAVRVKGLDAEEASSEYEGSELGSKLTPVMTQACVPTFDNVVERTTGVPVLTVPKFNDWGLS